MGAILQVENLDLLIATEIIYVKLWSLEVWVEFGTGRNKMCVCLDGRNTGGSIFIELGISDGIEAPDFI